MKEENAMRFLCVESVDSIEVTINLKKERSAMRFFQFEGADTVVAESEEQALDYYADLTGFEREDCKEDVEEVPGTEEMWVTAEFLTEEELTQAQTMQNGPDGELEYKLTMEKVYEREQEKGHPSAPYLIASTER